MSDSLTILGSGSGIPQAERATSGYALNVDGRLTLIDCGGGVTRSFLKSGLNPLGVDRIFISHTHSDHCCELTLFLQLIYNLPSRTEPLEVYVPDEFRDTFMRCMRGVYLFPEKFRFDLAVNSYGHGFRYEGDYVLEAHANSHLRTDTTSRLVDELQLPNRMQCHSLLIEVGGSTLLYSSDIGSFDDVSDLVAAAQVVLIESTHIDAMAIMELAEDDPEKRIYLTHIGPPPAAVQLQDAIDKKRLDNVALAEDGMIIPL